MMIFPDRPTSTLACCLEVQKRICRQHAKVEDVPAKLKDIPATSLYHKYLPIPTSNHKYTHNLRCIPTYLGTYARSTLIQAKSQAHLKSLSHLHHIIFIMAPTVSLGYHCTTSRATADTSAISSSIANTSVLSPLLLTPPRQSLRRPPS